MSDSLTSLLLSTTPGDDAFPNVELCSVCQGFVASIQGGQPNESYRHHKKRDLLQSAEGCPVCRLIITAFGDEFENPKFEQREEEQQFSLAREGLNTIRVSHGPFRVSYKQSTTQLAYLWLCTRFGDSGYALSECHLPCRSTDEQMELAAQWLSECVQSHPQCRKNVESPLPSRLIDVSQRTNSRSYIWINPLYDRNIPQAARELGKYAVLSYCWGTEPFLTLTPDNLESMKQGIEVDCLPQTIRDAIDVTRRLGIRFLWVDSLCILQGDSEEAQQDWLVESSKMCEVYGEAYICLTATVASNAHQGINQLSHEPPMTRRPGDPSLDRHFVRVGQAYIGLQSKHQWRDLQPLTLRSWALQESIMPPRLLQFQAKQISWDCAHHQKFECGTVDHYYPHLKLVFKQMQPSYSYWYDMVEEYSKRDLTHMSDKLPALAGLAQNFAQLMHNHDHYLAGIWKQSLPNALLWYVSGGGRPQRRLIGIPSWSWASIDGEITYACARHDTKEEVACERLDILKVGTRTAGDRFGQVSGGSLTIRGSLHAAWMKKPPYDNWYLYDSISSASASGNCSGTNLIFVDVQDEVPALLPSVPSLEPVWCLRITKKLVLLLKPVGENPIYQRIGLCSLGSRGEDLNKWFANLPETIEII